ncbi:YgiQ family radical SAM protein [Methanofollis formosanus]|uniref:YgiQ family radical SAM protein n=1 Tax=Methanofollis formosanus TaxID=299308 RepID=A0A8G1A263_9EURY|nr:YgiQ family radical SAM protein [Methanofollis formosanus]QYZ79656.1 YgiQ family radical SAM protein [Methanofollis formosanus]
MTPQPPFLPMTTREAEDLGIEQFDVVLITGDAYVDHPSFGTALLGRVLWDAGYTVGVIAQPDWKQPDDFLRLGRPRLFFGISSGNVDSMVNAFTPNKKRRSTDAYSPGGVPHRPDRALIVYANMVRSLFPETPIILGGIEASLRRFAHYDYWSDRVRQSVLADAPAALLVYGMGERQVVEAAARCAAGEDLHGIRGTAATITVADWREAEPGEDVVVIPGFPEVKDDPQAYARAFALHAREQDPVRGRTVVQPHPKTVVVQYPPARPLSTPELDRVYDLPYARAAHPSYTQPIPALEPVRFSITTHRGCFGSCSFCALTHHQGRIVQSRSQASILAEAERLAAMPEFKGVIQDVGGPTADMYGLTCPQWETHGACPDRRCSPDCPNLQTSHTVQVELLRRLRAIPGVRHVHVSSGIRFDLALADEEYIRELAAHHVSGHLKVAPEHIARRVTDRMNKPGREIFDRFRERFASASRAAGKKQYILPYFMSGHPGATLEDAVELAEYIRDHHLYTEQVQDFTPTPMTRSTCMYATGIDPITMEQVHVPTGREKQIQRALLQYRDPKNRRLVEEGLRAAGREDLIGTGWACLVRPQRGREQGERTRRPDRRR